MKFAQWALVLATLPAALAVGASRDENNCLTSAGYSWDEDRVCCKRPWEEKCADSINPVLGDDSADFQPHTFGGDGHDSQPHSLMGGDGHDSMPHTFGGDGHDSMPHGLIGGDDHDIRRDQIFGNDSADSDSHGLIGGGDHDYLPHQQSLLGANGHGQQQHMIGSMAGSIGPNREYYNACKLANRVIQNDGYTTIDPDCIKEMEAEAQQKASMAGSVGPNRAFYNACKEANRVIQNDGYTTIDPDCIKEMELKAQQVADAFSTFMPTRVVQQPDDRRMDAWYASCMNAGRTIQVEDGRFIVDPECLQEKRQMASLPSTSGIASIIGGSTMDDILPGVVAPKEILSGATAPKEILSGVTAPKEILSGATEECPKGHVMCTEESQAMGANCVLGTCTRAMHGLLPGAVAPPAVIPGATRPHFGGDGHDSVPHGCHFRCHKMLKPVCASNGVTYSNACTYRVAHCRQKKAGNTIKIVHPGSCSMKTISGIKVGQHMGGTQASPEAYEACSKANRLVNHGSWTGVDPECLKEEMAKVSKPALTVSLATTDF